MKISFSTEVDDWCNLLELAWRNSGMAGQVSRARKTQKPDRMKCDSATYVLPYMYVYIYICIYIYIFILIYYVCVCISCIPLVFNLFFVVTDSWVFCEWKFLLRGPAG